VVNGNRMNYQQLHDLFKETHRELQQRASRSVDTSLVFRNWLFGWYIVEFEQGGSDRAEYGTILLKKIAVQLKIKGCSERSLALCCKFYLTYSGILQAVSAKSSDRNIVDFRTFNRHGLLHLVMRLSILPQIRQVLSSTLARSFSL